MLQLNLSNSRRWLGACLAGWLLSIHWLAQAQAVYPFVVRTTPAGTTMLSPATAPLIPSRQLTAKAVYPGFSPGVGFDALVNAVVVQPDGRILVGGDFTNYQGTPCNRLVRLLADGSPDASFAPQAFNAVVSTIALQPNGAILVGGSFTNFASATPTRNYLVRLTTTGALDPTFAPASTGPVRTTGGATAVVASIAVQPSGNVVIGGNFDTYDGAPSKSLALLNSSGKKLSFSGTLFSQNVINELAVQPNGKIVGAGNFSTNYVLSLWRYNADGSDDTTFKNNVLSLPSEGIYPGQATGQAVAVYDDNTLAVARETSTGKYIHLLNGSGTATATTTYTGTVSTLAFQADGSVLAGGNFTVAGSTCYLIRFTPALIQNTNFTGLTGAVGAVAVQPNQQLVLGGDFVSYGGGTAKRLVRVEPAGALNTADVDIPNATYVWNNKTVGDKLVAVAAGAYSATATVAGVSATSSVVTVSGTVPSFTVRTTPTGLVNLCASGSQLLTAQVAGTTGTASYTWWKVQGTSATSQTANSTPAYSATSPGQYFATATVNGVLAASAITTVGLLPTPTISGSVSGLPGASALVSGSNFGVVTGVLFGTLPATFVVNSAAQLTATVPAGATTGTISVTTACPAVTGSAPFSVPAPTFTGFTPSGGQPGISVLLTGTGFIAGATSVSLNGMSIAPASITVNSGTQLTVVVPTNATTGRFAVTVNGVTATSTTTSSFTVSNAGTGVIILATPAQPLLTNSNSNPSTNQYNTLIIKAPSVVTVMRNPNSTLDYILIHDLEVQAGATLNIVGNARVICPGTLSVAPGATLNVGHPNGLAMSSTLALKGAVEFGTTPFPPLPALSPDANYGYIGTVAQLTGNGLPSQVRSLTVGNSPLTLTNAVSVTQVLKLGGTSNLNLDGKALTLLSNATGTALVVNSSTGKVLGNTAVVQRYINPVANTGTGFRYYGSPVKGATAAMLAAPAFDYDQSRYRLLTQQDTLPLISYGFSSSLAPNAPLAVGRGYRASVPAATTVNFTGTLTTGDTTITLLRTGKAAYNGWNLVSNPYPAPLSWNKLVAAADTAGLEAAIYVYESTGTNTGSYRSYVNGVSNDKLTNQNANGDLLLAMGQAFFVRVRRDRTTGTITFRNAYRETSYAQQAAFSRTTASSAPFKVSASLKKGGPKGGGPTGGCTCQSDRTALYIDSTLVNTATKPFNSQPFNSMRDADARNLFSFSQQTLSLRGGPGSADSTFAIRAVAKPLANAASPQAVPLAISATISGAYELELAVEELRKLGTGFVPYLHDKLHPDPLDKEWTALSGTATVTYPFNLSAIDILNGVSNRFEIVFNYGTITATAPGVGLSSVAVYPNPTQHHIHVWMPALPGATQVQTTLLNTMGQVVRQQSAPLLAAGTTLDLDAEGLASGVYILRLQAGSISTTRRVVLEN